MKAVSLFFALLLCMFSFSWLATQLPHGKVFGTKPDTTKFINAPQIETFMANKTRISATIRGKVMQVTKPKGGWFDIDAGKGKVIAAHFRDYNVTIPKDLKGRFVFADGIAAKQFIADDLQHFAGDTAKGKKQHSVKTNPNKRLTFEVKGLMVE